MCSVYSCDGENGGINVEDIITFLKEQLSQQGERWKTSQDRELIKDCIATVEAINILEERAYGKSITDITYMLG